MYYNLCSVNLISKRRFVKREALFIMRVKNMKCIALESRVGTFTITNYTFIPFSLEKRSWTFVRKNFNGIAPYS